MKKSFVLITVVLLLVAFIAGAYALYEVLGSNYTPPVAVQPTEPAGDKDTAPDFTVLDGNGKEVKLSDFFGTPLVVNFWATWCGPCKNELPDFDTMAKEYQDQVEFIMVNMTDGYAETVSSVTAFLATNGYSFPVYFDTKAEAAMAYNANALPTTYFIDADGTIASYHLGMISADTLRQRIEGLLSEPEPTAEPEVPSGTEEEKVGVGVMIAAAVAVVSLCGAAAAAVMGIVNKNRTVKPAGSRTTAGRTRHNVPGTTSSGSGRQGRSVNQPDYRKSNGDRQERRSDDIGIPRTRGK